MVRENFQFPISNQLPSLAKRNAAGDEAKPQRPSNFKSQTTNRIKFYPNRYFKNSYNPFLGLKAMKEVKGVVEDFGPDVVHCHSTVASFWTRLAIKSKIPTIFTAHGWAFTEGASFFRRIFFPFIEGLAAKFCDKIICDSDHDRQLALKYKIVPGEKIITIHNGVEIDKTKSVKRKAQNFDLKCRIVFVGRLAEPKKPEFLLKTFSELSSEIKEKTQVIIIGDGPKKEFIISSFKFLKNVDFLGSLPRKKVFEILRESDIFVLISNYEGFPMTILEAMSCGLPVIASNVGGVSEVFHQDQDKPIGYLIERKDIEGLKKTLTELIENAELRERMGQNARERVEKEFSLDKMLKETKKVYNEII